MAMIGVTVVGKSQVGIRVDNGARHDVGMGRAAVGVDVEAVWRDRHRDHLGAELPQHRRGDPVGCAIGAIDHDPHALQVELARQGALGELDVAGMHALDALGAAQGR